MLDFSGQTSRLFNASELAGRLELGRPTIREYLTLLEQVFLIDILTKSRARHNPAV